MTAKEFDVVVFGATGFTGGLVAEYLAKHDEKDKFSFALAGRNVQKLERLKTELLEKHKSTVEIIVADVANADSLAEMASRAKVVITTVGPYGRYGEPLVKACIEQKADYVDLVGEPNFVDVIRYRYHEQALEAGVKIINACGFDSIPHDLGVLFALKALHKKFPESEIEDLQVNCKAFVSTNASFSGGTWHSAVNAMSEALAHDKVKRQWKQEGYLGSEKIKAGRKVKLSYLMPRKHGELDGWIMPLPTIDPEIVARSAQLRDDYGFRFSYGHHILLQSFWHMPAMMLGISGAMLLAQFRWGRKQLLKVIDAGDGPDEVKRQQSWFKVQFSIRAKDALVRAEVSGGDPGYTETSKMLAESALCLVLQRDQTPDFFGVTTSAAGLGEVMIDRLQKAGLQFKEC